MNNEEKERFQTHLIRVYPRDLSLEVFLNFSESVQIFENQENSLVFDPNLTCWTENIGKNLLEHTAHLKLSAKIDEATIYLLEVQLVGVFSIQNSEKIEQEALESVIQAILFPYLSEITGNLTIRTGFPPMNLMNVIGSFVQTADQEPLSGEK